MASNAPVTGVESYRLGLASKESAPVVGMARLCSAEKRKQFGLAAICVLLAELDEGLDEARLEKQVARQRAAARAHRAQAAERAPHRHRQLAHVRLRQGVERLR